MRQLISLLKVKWPFVALVLTILIFFRSTLFLNLLPIPADTIIGLYHPFRDFYAKEYPRGIPFKNFLITDPVRQTLPWRELATNIAKKGQLPLWNPYSMTGMPLFANSQSAVFNPLNILFFVLPFFAAWSLVIIIQPFLASIFMYFYLRNLHLVKPACLLGALTFAFSGFLVAWLTWGTVAYVVLWLPLILLSIDRIFQIKKLLIWSFIFIFSLVASFFAGHLQTFFYVLLISIAYILTRWWQFGKNKKTLWLFVICYLLFVAVTAVQWLPTLQLISESARNIDLNYQKPGWFIPLKHLAQFVAPDFFGNPTTLNYFGVWNYGELVGYIGIIPLIFAFIALLWRRDKKTAFFILLTLLAVVFATDNPIAKLPYRLNLPLISTGQPTRLLAIIDFALAILAALGLDLFLKKVAKQKTLLILIITGIIFLALWAVTLKQNLFLISRNNLILPTGVFVLAASCLLIISWSNNRVVKKGILLLLIGLTMFDLLRFAGKFTPATPKEYLFPQTKTIEFLKEKEEEGNPFRIMTTDDRLFPPNFSVIYRIQAIDGYDPLYLKRYGELIAASERGQPNISTPFGFNRIITPKNFDSKMIDLLGVKYILSLSDISSAKLIKVFQEGQTQVYENKEVLPRVFFVEDVSEAKNKNEAIRIMFDRDIDLSKTAVVESEQNMGKSLVTKWNVGKAEIIHYSENEIVIITENDGTGFLVLTDSFYPTWQAKINGVQTKIYRTDYNFRGIIVPAEKQTIVFSSKLL